jgi:hypothetical protein
MNKLYNIKVESERMRAQTLNSLNIKYGGAFGASLRAAARFARNEARLKPEGFIYRSARLRRRRFASRGGALRAQ